MRLSIMTISAPGKRAGRSRIRCEPIWPSAPVTTIFMAGARSLKHRDLGHVDDPLAARLGETRFLLADFGLVVPGEQQGIFRIALGEFRIGAHRDVRTG